MLLNIDRDTVIEMLLDRLNRWTDDHTTHKLYRYMYESYIYGGCMDGAELDVMDIVDNDYINYCTVIEEGYDEWEDIKQLFEEQGCGDISCEETNHGYNYIEAEYNGSFLVRY